ncbi:DUF2029 domain-containing protein [Patescibacteria group bacterium]|nr:DUF2029 domain-containing protein [Patescibacteria group bacterium]
MTTCVVAKMKRITVIVFFFFLIFSIAEQLKNNAESDAVYKMDFSAFYRGAYMVKNGKIRSLYVLADQLKYQREIGGENADVFLPYRYPPLMAYLYSPLLHTDIVNAYDIFVILITILYFLLIGFFVRYFKLDALYIVYAVLFYPALTFLFNGQFTLLLLLSIIVSYIALDKEKDCIAGVVSSILFLKLQYLTFVPFLCVVSKDRRKFIFGFTIAVVLLFLLSTFQYGLDFGPDYLSFLIASEKPSFGSGARNLFNLFSLVEYIPDTFVYKNSILFVSKVLNLIILGIFLVHMERKKELPLYLRVAVAFLLVLVFNFHVSRSDLALAVFPILLIIRSFRDNILTNNRRVAILISMYVTPWFHIIGIEYIDVSVYLFIALWFMYKYPKYLGSKVGIDI